jgi:hypothetical protein
MGYPDFVSGDVLNASDMNAVGLWLVKTQTVGTAVSSVTVTGAFSANYDNYRIVYANGAATNADFLLLTLSGGSGNSYAWGAQYYNFGGAATTTTSGLTTSARIGVMGGKAHYCIDICSPFLSAITTFTSQNSSDSYSWVGGGINNQTVSHTGFTLAPAAGTITGGTIRVYGYRN